MMRKIFKLTTVALMIMGMVAVVGCKKDDDNENNNAGSARLNVVKYDCDATVTFDTTVNERTYSYAEISKYYTCEFVIVIGSDTTRHPITSNHQKLHFTYTKLPTTFKSNFVMHPKADIQVPEGGKINLGIMPMVALTYTTDKGVSGAYNSKARGFFMHEVNISTDPVSRLQSLANSVSTLSELSVDLPTQLTPRS